jgi:hypothetical protein
MYLPHDPVILALFWPMASPENSFVAPDRLQAKAAVPPLML